MITSGPMEGTNNKIKTMKRQAYGFRDQEFFKLKILAIHETKYELGFIRRKRAPGLKRVDMLTPLGVAFKDSNTGRSACPPACCTTPSASAATSTPAPDMRAGP